MAKHFLFFILFLVTTTAFVPIRVHRHPINCGISSTKALDFDASPLSPNVISPITWASTGEQVSPHSYRLGLNPKLTTALLDFCMETGITSTFWSLLNGNPLRPGTFATVPLQDGKNWHVQRPDSAWKTDAHYISPSNEQTHEKYLEVLSDGGFDDALDSIGKRFGFDGLVAYHLTFLGLSSCAQPHHVHTDFHGIEGKGFNLIIPLILADEASPELELQQHDNEDRIGNYKYVLDEANMVGDSVGHATAACDYEGEMRMAATVYVADVSDDNAKHLASFFAQAYPKRKDAQFLVDRAGSHWKHDDPTISL